jgi:LysR family cys regulon transcriptional activator
LPKVVKVFKDAFPKVHLVLHQGSPAEIVSMLQTGQADIGIATEALDTAPEIATFPYYQWRHALIVPKGHPLASLKGLTLKDIAAYPIITYHEGYTGRGQLDKAFADEGLAPDIVMSALDADVIKAYVELGLGIGIVASMAYYAERDTNLSLSESEHLFRLNTTLIGVRRGHYLRGYAYKFIELCAAEHTEAIVRQQATQLA